MKKMKVLCVLLCICSFLMAFSVCAAAEEEQSAPDYLVMEGCTCGYLGEDIAFAGEYDAVKAEYDVWLFTDEQGEKMTLVTEKGLVKEEISFRYRGTVRVGLPENAEAIDWAFFTAGRQTKDWNKIGKSSEEVRQMVDEIEYEVYLMNLAHYESPETYVRDEMKIIAKANTARLVSPYLLLGGCYDLNNDGIYQEQGIDNDGDLKLDITVFSVGGSTKSKQPTRYGDVNGDGVTNMKDLLTLRYDIATGVEGVSMEDLLHLRLYLAGIFWINF